MKLDVSGVISGKAVIDNQYLEFEIPDGYLEEFGAEDVSKVKARIDVRGQIENQLDVRADYNFHYSVPCSRCLKKVLKEENLEISKVIFLDKKGEDYEDDLEYLEDNQLLVEKMIMEDIIFKMPIRVLCSEDCKGICSGCGADLNESECKCENDEIDPRFEELKKFFKQ